MPRAILEPDSLEYSNDKGDGYLKQLEPREKRAIIIGGVASALILIFVFVFTPIHDDYTRKQQRIPKMERDLEEMRLLRGQYIEIQKWLQEAQKAAADRPPLLTDIENITRRANLSGKIASLKPQQGVQTAGFTENIVEIRMENVALYDIVNFVFLLEKEHFRIRKLWFKQRFDNPKLLNSTILISSAG